MDLQFKTFPFEVKAGGDASTFEGLVSVFHNIDSYGEIVDDGAFDEDLSDFMANGFIGGLNHDWDNPIGTPQPGTKTTPNGLHLVGSVIDTTHGMDVRKMLKAGVVKKLSIGYREMGSERLEDADAVASYWEKKGYSPNAQDMARAVNGATVLTRVKLYEGSPVTVPANDLAMITAVKAAREAAEQALRAAPAEEPTPNPNEPYSSIAEAEDCLREAGLSRTEAKRMIANLKTLLRDAASDDTKPAEPGPDEDAPSPAPAETPEPETDEPPADSETLTDDAEPAAEVPEIVTPPATEEPAPEKSLIEQEIERKRQRLARDITLSVAELNIEIERSLSRFAGA
jgi:HK97 family phage prohead protease